MHFQYTLYKVYRNMDSLNFILTERKVHDILIIQYRFSVTDG